MNKSVESMPPPFLTIPESARAQREQFAAAYLTLERAISEHAFPGAAFGILAAGKVLALDGLGRFTFDPLATPVTASTVFDLASITKVIATTSMAMLLYDRGQLQLDQPLAQVLPRFAQNQGSEHQGARNKGTDSRRQQVTLRMLLAHASGLPGYARLFLQARGRPELLNACFNLPLETLPGSRSEYSDPGFILLGHALETIAGENLASFCAREIFAPLGMTSTCFQPPVDWRSTIPPTEEDISFRHRIIQGEVQDENCFTLGGVGGHAGLFSNALDPLRYAQCLLGQYGIPGQTATGLRLFRPETIQLFTAKAQLPPGSSRALGWDTPSQPSSSGHFFSSHSAGHLGYAGTSLWIDFGSKIAVVLLTNRTWPRRENQAIRTIRPEFHDAVMEALREVGEQEWH